MSPMYSPNPGSPRTLLFPQDPPCTPRYPSVPRRTHTFPHAHEHGHPEPRCPPPTSWSPPPPIQDTQVIGLLLSSCSMQEAPGPLGSPAETTPRWAFQEPLLFNPSVGEIGGSPAPSEGLRTAEGVFLEAQGCSVGSPCAPQGPHSLGDIPWGCGGVWKPEEEPIPGE